MSRFVPAANLEELVADASTGDRAKVASKVVERARRGHSRRTGGYARSLRVVVDDRGVVAESTDFAGHMVEWGSVNNPPQAPLRNAASSVGRFEPK